MKENSFLKKRVGIWIRVSTEDQARGESPQHHEARAREYAKFNEWSVIEVYDLAGVSGKTVMENAEAKRMIADIKRGHITGLIFSKLARLARSPEHALERGDQQFLALPAPVVAQEVRQRQRRVIPGNHRRQVVPRPGI